MPKETPKLQPPPPEEEGKEIELTDQDLIPAPEEAGKLIRFPKKPEYSAGHAEAVRLIAEYYELEESRRHLAAGLALGGGKEDLADALASTEARRRQIASEFNALAKRLPTNERGDLIELLKLERELRGAPPEHLLVVEPPPPSATKEKAAEDPEAGLKDLVPKIVELRRDLRFIEEAEAGHVTEAPPEPKKGLLGRLAGRFHKKTPEELARDSLVERRKHLAALHEKARAGEHPRNVEAIRADLESLEDRATALLLRLPDDKLAALRDRWREAGGPHDLADPMRLAEEERRKATVERERKEAERRAEDARRGVFRIGEKEFPIIKLEIGGKTAWQLKKELKKSKVNVSDYAEDMMRSPAFTTGKKSEPIDLVRLAVKDLGLPGNPTTDQIYARAAELGLELCPPEVGPQYRLQYADQPMDERVCIGMKQITDRDGSPRVFELARGGDGLWLGGDWARPDDRWSPDDRFVLRPRKSKT
jgi:hypothetical protein